MSVSLFGFWVTLATALPTIVEDLKGAENYSWVGSSYLLASATFTPIYGRARHSLLCARITISDLFGRKPILYGSIVIFLIGSALCGAAQCKHFKLFCRAQLMFSNDLVDSCTSLRGNRCGRHFGIDNDRHRRHCISRRPGKVRGIYQWHGNICLSSP